MNKIVLIADNHSVSVNGTTFILKCISKDILIEHVKDEEELLERLKHNHYDLLILEIKIFGNIFEPSIQKLKELNPDLKIMVFTESNENLVFPYLCGGAQAYLYKSYSKEKIHEAIESIFNIGYYYQQELLYDLIHTMKAGSMYPRSLLDSLSEREREVYYHLIEGNGILEIANLLEIHQSTVSIYKRRIFEKLQIKTLAGLIDFHNKHKIYTINGSDLM
ncbi:MULTISPECIES: response regulator [Chryseobacterium]|uniref:DNA-binding response regulator n=2 Tax=Chryseobacterium TaxID=59732 RepID=A0A3M7TIM5_9FLAO|nr:MULTISPECIES: response regulator transcription factor [Chryseobacterium]RNA63285.1 DNA-binding response regulator [Chryseobacterium nematophagum]CAA7387593.1 Response regulator UvrY [Chryseobacterium fistulae]